MRNLDSQGFNKKNSKNPKNRIEEELEYIFQIKENLGLIGIKKNQLIQEMIDADSNILLRIKYSYNNGHETAHIGTNRPVHINDNIYLGVDIKCQKGSFNKFIVKDISNGNIGVLLVSGEKIILDNLEMDLNDFHLICDNGGFFIYLENEEIHVEEISGNANEYYDYTTSKELRIIDSDYKRIVEGLKSVDINVINTLINQGLDTNSIIIKLLEYKMITKDTADLIYKYSHLIKII